MKLYYSPGACSLAAHIVLEESGAKYEAQRVSLRDGEQRKPDYLKINWKGKVPALALEGGQVLTENPVIQSYVADTHARAGLLAPVGELERYRALEWLAWCASFVQPSIGPLWHPPVTDAQREAAQKAIDHFDHHLQGKKFVLGDRFSIADSYTIVFWRWAKGLKLSPGAAHRSAVEQLLARPAVERVIADEGIKVELG